MFRPAIRPIFLAISAAAMPIFLLLVLLDDGLHPDWIALFAATTGLALFAIVSAWTFHFLFPDGISAEGHLGAFVLGASALCSLGSHCRGAPDPHSQFALSAALLDNRPQSDMDRALSR